MATSLECIRTRRNLPFVKRGMRVCVDGRWGRIQYFDKDGKVIQEFGD